jgi:hypothetical protein
MNRIMLWTLMVSIFVVLSFSIIATTKQHMSDSQKAGNLHIKLMELADSVECLPTKEVTVYVTDTITVEMQKEPVKIYVYDTIKIQDTIYLQ